MQSYSSWLARLYGWACWRLYHELAWSYDLVSWLVSLGRWPAWRRAALNYLPPSSVGGGAARLLELGFGTGELIRELVRRDLAPVGLEPSVAMQQITSSKLRRSGQAAALVCGQAQALPFADGSFDAIIATFPANYILAESTLHEVVRLLTPDDPVASSTNARLIVVGLWVGLASPTLTRLLPLFYGEPSSAWFAQVDARLAQAGLCAAWSVYEDGFARVSILVASRLGQPPAPR